MERRVVPVEILQEKLNRRKEREHVREVLMGLPRQNPEGKIITIWSNPKFKHRSFFN